MAVPDCFTHSLLSPIYLSNHLSIYGSTVLLLDLCRFFSFLILYTVDRTPLRGISQSQGRCLHTEQHKHRINAHRYSCLEWDSNPRSQPSSESYTARPLRSASVSHTDAYFNFPWTDYFQGVLTYNSTAAHVICCVRTLSICLFIKCCRVLVVFLRRSTAMFGRRMSVHNEYRAAFLCVGQLSAVRYLEQGTNDFRNQ
jgi:hypothetical protein